MLALQRPATGDDLSGDAATIDPRPVVDIIPFEPWHLARLDVRVNQQPLWVPLTPEYGAALQAAGPCFSAFVGIDVIACAGVMALSPGRAQVWALMSEQMPQYGKTIHKAVKTFLRDYRVRRLECLVDPRDRAAVNWARRLGFQFESIMAAYTPHGDDQAMMVRIER